MPNNAPTALITGGTSSVGRAAAEKLAQLGIHLLVVGRNLERGENTVAEIRAAEGEADFISGDLRDASSAHEVARRTVELGNGHVDILSNSAGVFPFGPKRETIEELSDDVYSLNVKYFLVAELAPLTEDAQRFEFAANRERNSTLRAKPVRRMACRYHSRLFPYVSQREVDERRLVEFLAQKGGIA